MIARFIKSVGYALNGFKVAILEERNMRIDIVVLIYVWWFSLFYNLSTSQYALLSIITFMIPAFELMNTAVERAVDRPDKEHYISAGAAKDVAAASVLTMSLGAVIAGIFLFWDTTVFSTIIKYYTSNIFRPLILVLTIGIAILFIKLDDKGK